MTPGPLLFARYAYAPNALGYCGADEPRTLLEYGDAKASDRGLAELARTFEGAWPYLQLIASANRIDDPLDPRVVDAYWVGNGLLDGIGSDALARHVEDRFRGRVGRGWQDVLDAVAAGAVPHHSFHVFAVYPWLGLMRTGVVDEPLRVLDQCRTTPALVQSVDGDTAASAGAAPRLERARAHARPVGAAGGALAGGRPRFRRRASARRLGIAALGLRLRAPDLAPRTAAPARDAPRPRCGQPAHRGRPPRSRGVGHPPHRCVSAG